MFLVGEGVVVVTINYRLGPIGFLYLPSIGIFGNNGLKDQQLALQWVHENIELFGGDPRNVTVFGESAGAASTQFHLLNQKSRKFFHKAVLQSGNALNDWVLQVDPEQKAIKLAQLLGCTSTKPEDLLETLMQADAYEITRMGNRTLSADEKRRGLPLAFKPVVEVPNESAFITKHPMELMKKKNIFGGIPIISGFNNNEGIVMCQDALIKIKQYNTDVNKYIPR